MTKNSTNTENDTPTIDEKKLKKQFKKSSKNLSNIGLFFINMFIIILIIIGYFLFSSFILYTCKLAQSNIIPTNMDCYPFKETKPQLQEIWTNIFITNTDPQESVKLNFPYNSTNSKSFLLDAFRNYKYSSQSNNVLNYFISILEGLINYNNNAINAFLNMLNNLPEILIVLFGPVIYSTYLALVSFIGFFVGIYYYFSSMSWFFKTNASNSDSTATKRDVTLLEPIQYGFAVFLLFVFFIVFWLLLFTGCITLLPIIILFICLFSTFGYVSKTNTKDVNILYIAKEFFKNYKVMLSIIISFFVIISAFANIGITPGIFSILTIILIYFGIIPLGMFQSTKFENLSKITNFKQAEKVCNSNKQSVLENVFGSQNGGNIIKELKKISKKIQNN